MGTGTTGRQIIKTYNTVADYSEKQFYAVVATTAETCTLAGANEKAIGIIQNKPGSGQAADVAMPGGNALAIVSESVTAGKYLTPTSAGKLEVADAASEHCIGIALEAGDADDVIEIAVQVFEAAASDA